MNKSKIVLAVSGFTVLATVNAETFANRGDPTGHCLSETEQYYVSILDPNLHIILETYSRPMQ